MIRFALRALIFFASAAIGLLVAALLLDDVEVTLSGFLIVVVVFAVLQSVLGPFIAKVAAKNATAFLGGIGLVTTFVALLVSTLVSDSLDIDGGVVTWIAATVIVWLVTALATVLLPVFLIKEAVEEHRDNHR